MINRVCIASSYLSSYCFTFFVGESNRRRRSRKRTRDSTNWKSSIKKQKVQNGQEHVTKSGRKIAAKIFSGQIFCKCRLRCHERIDVVIQKSYFDQYYGLNSWSMKTKFLRSLIERHSAKESINPKINLKPRNFISKYYLKNEEQQKLEVCSLFFAKILRISRATLFRATRSIANNPLANERRGLYPTRRTDARRVQFVKKFIRQFPRFESHHDYKSLHPQLTSKKLQTIYVEECSPKEVTPTTLSMFRRIFARDFNLRFKTRTKMCKTCERIGDQASSLVLSKEMQKTLKNKKIKHINEVRRVKNDFVHCINEATDGLNQEQILSFGLDKFEVPFVADINILKLRPLWCYNLCIYDEVRKKNFMFVWDESIAACGSQEIGSCLFHYLNHYIPEYANKIIFYCDPRSGQMKNLKIAVMLQNFNVNESIPEIESIDQRFTIPGHSHNRCSFVFAFIRKKRKESKSIYSPEHWANVMSNISEEKTNFTVVKMKRENFFNIMQLKELVVKPNASIKKIWPTIRAIIYERGEPDSVKIKQSFDDKPEIILFPLF